MNIFGGDIFWIYLGIWYIWGIWGIWAIPAHMGYPMPIYLPLPYSIVVGPLIVLTGNSSIERSGQYI